MRFMRCEPANSIIQRLGGVSAVARAAEVSTVTVNRWCYPPERGGTGGFIPRQHHQKIIEFAESAGVPLTLGAFVDERIARAIPTAPAPGAAHVEAAE